MQFDRLTPDQERFLLKLYDGCRRTDCYVWKLYRSELCCSKGGQRHVIPEVPAGTSFYCALDRRGYLIVVALPVSPQSGVEWEKLEITVLGKTLEFGEAVHGGRWRSPDPGTSTQEGTAMPTEGSNEGTTRGRPGGDDYVEPSGGQARILLTMSRDEADHQLRKQIRRGKELLAEPLTGEQDLEDAKVEMRKWSDYNWELLTSMADGDALANGYKLPRRLYEPLRPSFAWLVKDYRRAAKTYIGCLESIVGRLELFAEPTDAVHPPQREVGRSMGSSSQIFIVHGHDEPARDSVALCIQRLGLQAVILHERPDRGRTIIEKFEQYSDVGFAVVLLTPDDLGMAKDEDEPKPRARQNVIFELGFFIGKLGRENVCALHKGDVEILSDYQGVLWKSMEGDGWRFELVRELKAAGFDVDANKLVS